MLMPVPVPDNTTSIRLAGMLTTSMCVDLDYWVGVTVGNETHAHTSALLRWAAAPSLTVSSINFLNQLKCRKLLQPHS